MTTTRMFFHVFKGCCGWQNGQSDGNGPEKRGGQAWEIITDQV